MARTKLPPPRYNRAFKWPQLSSKPVKKNPESAKARLARERAALKAKRAVLHRKLTTEVDARILTKKLRFARETKRFKTQSFKHAPLDLSSNAIRLVEVHPYRADQRIRCTIRHTTTAAIYTCLSYVWGPQEPTRFVTVNGALCEVRENLWQFLHAASSRLARMNNVGLPQRQDDSQIGFDFVGAVRAVWIDALCIDQSHVLERNHQVQQMGAIYSNAQQVITWIGADLRNQHNPSNMFRRINGKGNISTSSWDGSLLSSLQAFDASPYWTRAWITQEFLLARRLVFLSGRSAADITQIHHLLVANPPSQVLKNRHLWEPLVNIQRGPRGSRPNSLLKNLALFRLKACEQVRDKIYSLLSISHDATDLKVDYDSPLPALLLDILRRYGEHFCLCHARMILSTFQVYVSSAILDLFPGSVAEPFATMRAKEISSYSNHQCGHCQDHADLSAAKDTEGYSAHTVTQMLFEHYGRNIRTFPTQWHKMWWCCLRCEHTYISLPQRTNFGHLLIMQGPSTTSFEVFHLLKEQGGSQETFSLVSRGIKVVNISPHSTFVLVRIYFGGLCDLINPEPLRNLKVDPTISWHANDEEVCHGSQRTDVGHGSPWRGDWMVQEDSSYATTYHNATTNLRDAPNIKHERRKRKRIQVSPAGSDSQD